MQPLAFALLLLMSVAPTSAQPCLSATQAEPDSAKQDLARASKLRDDSVKSWEAKRYDEAVLELRAADEIYVRLPGDYPEDRAVVLRAIVWNLKLGGRFKDALDPLAALTALTAEHEEFLSETRGAYGALYDAATEQKQLNAGLELLRTCRAIFEEHEHLGMAAQTLHDSAGLAGNRGDLERMQALFAESLQRRASIGDRVGLAWSYNNLAYHLLKAERYKDALEPLTTAFELVRSDAFEAQTSVGINLGKAFEHMLEQKRLPASSATWVWKLAESARRLPGPEAMPFERILRTAMALQARQGKKQAWAAAETVKGHIEEGVLSQLPKEVVTDLTLRAAAVALEAGHVKEARAWTKKLVVGKGPCGPHLEARRDTLRAVALAASGDRRGYDKLAPTAADAWRELMDDRAGRMDALERLVEAGESLVKSKAHSKIEREYVELRRSGGPGGLGGSSNSGKVAESLDGLGPRTPAISVRMEKGRIVLRDLLSKHSAKLDVLWRPKHFNFNGLAATLFGGYFEVRAMNYGSGPSSGSPSLGALAGSYRPLPAKGALIVHLNGSTSYDLD